MVYQVPNTESPAMSLPKNVSTMLHRLFAMMTFFARPMMMRSEPSHTSSSVVVRLSISFSIVL